MTNTLLRICKPVLPLVTSMSPSFLGALSGCLQQSILLGQMAKTDHASWQLWRGVPGVLQVWWMFFIQIHWLYVFCTRSREASWTVCQSIGKVLQFSVGAYYQIIWSGKHRLHNCLPLKEMKVWGLLKVSHLMFSKKMLNSTSSRCMWTSFVQISLLPSSVK